MKKSLISVVVPVFNEEKAVGKFLDEQLMPTLDKIDEAFEIVIVDDGSKDKSVEKVKSAKIRQNRAHPSRVFGRDAHKGIKNFVIIYMVKGVIIWKALF